MPSPAQAKGHYPWPLTAANFRHQWRCHPQTRMAKNTRFTDRSVKELNRAAPDLQYRSPMETSLKAYLLPTIPAAPI